jgi:hypothetical protein
MLGVVDVSGCGGSVPASNGRGSRTRVLGGGFEAAMLVEPLFPMFGVAKLRSSVGRAAAGGCEVRVPSDVDGGEADVTAERLLVVVVVVDRSGFVEPAVATADVVVEGMLFARGGTLVANGCDGADMAAGEA